VDSLANGDVLKWEVVMALDNETVLLKQMMNADRATIEHTQHRQMMSK